MEDNAITLLQHIQWQLNCFTFVRRCVYKLVMVFVFCIFDKIAISLWLRKRITSCVLAHVKVMMNEKLLCTMLFVSQELMCLLEDITLRVCYDLLWLDSLWNEKMLYVGFESWPVYRSFIIDIVHGIKFIIKPKNYIVFVWILFTPSRVTI